VQLAVARLPLAKVPVCFLTEASLVAFATGNPLPIEIYTIPADADLEAYIVERCGKVWQHVEARTLPEPETPRDARLLYRKDSGEIIEADEAIAAVHAELLIERAAEKAVAVRIDDLKAQIQAFMKEASEIRYLGRALCTWKKGKDRAAYTVAAREGSRTFLIKETT